MPAVMVDYIRRRDYEQNTSDHLDSWRAYDSNEGIRKRVRERKFAEWFHPTGAISLEQVKQTQNVWRAPPEMQAAFDHYVNEGFGERAKIDGHPRFVLFLHPYFERICLGEAWLHRDERAAGGNGIYYNLVCIFDEAPVEGELPSDYDGKPHLKHLRGTVGEFKVPTGQEFEVLARACDRWRLSTDEIMERLVIAPQREIDKENDRLLSDYLLDRAEYFANLFIDAVNRDEGACDRGTAMMPVTRVEPNQHGDRFVVREVNGITMRARRGTRLADEIETAAAEEAAAARARRDADLSKLEEAARRRQLLAQAEGAGSRRGRTL